MNIRIFDAMEKISQTLVPLLGKQLLYSTILFLVIFPLANALRKRSSYWQLGLWTLVLLRLVLPPDLSVPWSARNLPEHLSRVSAPNVDTQEIGSAVSMLLSKSATNLPVSEDSIIKNIIASSPDVQRKFMLSRWYVAGFMLWLAGVLVFSARYVMQLTRCRRLLKQASPVQNSTINEILRQCCAQFGIKRPVHLVSSARFPSPFTSGIFRPTIFLPDRLLHTKDTTLVKTILAHEIVHITRYDNVWMLCQNILQILYFFHPLVWYAANRLNLVRECICDHLVMSKCRMSTRAYGGSLLYVMECNLIGAERMDILPAFSNQKKNLAYRIQKLQGGKNMQTYQRALIVLVVLLLGLVALPMAADKIQASDSAIENPLSDLEKQTSSGDVNISTLPPTPAFLCPLQKGHITAGFGLMQHPVTQETYHHRGIDIAVKIGTPIYAVADGTVISAQDVVDNDYGKNIILEHADGYTSRYAKLSEILVQEGQTVKAGEQIALSGNSGVSTGPHLHFELLRDGMPRNPETMIDFTELAAK
jgi:murein DD-endopeptidase MepM/ murein hydrolase activator NlpD/Zn-dependent protease with chaperone function